MFEIQTPRNRKNLLALAITTALLTLSGCGGGSDNGGATPGNGGNNPGGGNAAPPDVSSLTDTALRSSLTKGMTQGVTANTKAFTDVFNSAPALKEVTGKVGGAAPTGQTKSLQAVRAPGGNSAAFDFSGFNMDESMSMFDAMIDKGHYTKNGNVYTFDPDENKVCTLDTESTPQEVADCKTILSHITFIVTVNSVANDQVTAATTQFKYDTSTFAITDFTANTGYYQLELAGSKVLLNALNDIAAPADKMVVPTTMEGSLRVGFKALSENSGSVTVSVPQAIALTDNTPGEEIQLSLGKTDKLLSMSADAATNSMDLEVGFGALDMLIPKKDNSGNSFPVQLTLAALTGKMSVDANGTELKLSGLSADSVRFKVDGQDALTLGLTSLDAVLDASHNKAIVTLKKALNFNVAATNVNAYLTDFLDSTSPSYTASAQIKAPANTVLSEVTDSMTKVTGGPLDITINETGKPGVSVSVPTGLCLDTSADTPTTAVCPPSS